MTKKTPVVWCELSEEQNQMVVLYPADFSRKAMTRAQVLRHPILLVFNHDNTLLKGLKKDQGTRHLSCKLGDLMNNHWRHERQLLIFFAKKSKLQLSI